MCVSVRMDDDGDINAHEQVFALPFLPCTALALPVVFLKVDWRQQTSTNICTLTDRLHFHLA